MSRSAQWLYGTSAATTDNLRALGCCPRVRKNNRGSRSSRRARLPQGLDESSVGVRGMFLQAYDYDGRWAPADPTTILPFGVAGIARGTLNDAGSSSRQSRFRKSGKDGQQKWAAVAARCCWRQFSRQASRLRRPQPSGIHRTEARGQWEKPYAKLHPRHSAQFDIDPVWHLVG